MNGPCGASHEVAAGVMAPKTSVVGRCGPFRASRRSSVSRVEVVVIVERVIGPRHRRPGRNRRAPGGCRRPGGGRRERGVPPAAVVVAGKAIPISSRYRPHWLRKLHGLHSGTESR